MDPTESSLTGMKLWEVSSLLHPKLLRIPPHLGIHQDLFQLQGGFMLMESSRPALSIPAHHDVCGDESLPPVGQGAAKPFPAAPVCFTSCHNRLGHPAHAACKRSQCWWRLVLALCMLRSLPRAASLQPPRLLLAVGPAACCRDRWGWGEIDGEGWHWARSFCPWV